MSIWTRRHFLGSAAATVTFGRSEWHAEAALSMPVQEKLPPPTSQANSPEIISGALRPLLESNVDRPLRYRPTEGGFTIHNGREFFNRPLYGPNIPFRVDGGDRPEFSLYLPGHGGNLRLGFKSSQGNAVVWAHECADIRTTYVDGHLNYELRDPAFGSNGAVTIDVLTSGAALWCQVIGRSLAYPLELVWAFGGVSGRKGKRNGDIGCEVEPVSRFFQLRPQECDGNRWSMSSEQNQHATAWVSKDKLRLKTVWPTGAVLKLSDAARWNDGWQALWTNATTEPAQPLLIGRAPLLSSPVYLTIEAETASVLPASSSTSDQLVAGLESFRARLSELQGLSRALSWSTPDPYLDCFAGALNNAVQAIWDEAQGCVMHGGVAWRIALAGWRGPYALDTTGLHTRMRRHLRHWIAKQNTSQVTNGSGGRPTPAGFIDVVEAHGAPDPGSHGARTENLLHSAGDLSHNHYDMNLVFFDALLRHLRWTGDLDFAREAWPALERHAAWERRLFRRNYGTEADPLPLYEAYAAIWASDNLQYNGGGAAHSSAYNIFLNRGMADLARQLGMTSDVSAAYTAEADAIGSAMRRVLWITDRGCFAEGRDWLAERRVFEDPAAWTVYHTIDSEVASPFEAWQIASERLRALRKVPVRGTDVPTDAGYLLPCSDWHPYVWSLTLLVTAENLHTGLALFQAGMSEEAFGLLRGTLIDCGFRGLCPGNFPMSLQLDPHRQESQRDFGDPIGCASRAIVEGLWGVQPDVLNGRLHLQPGLPLDWNDAALKHPDLEIVYQHASGRDVWTITSKFSRPLQLSLQLRARATGTPHVLIDGTAVRPWFEANAVGEPKLRVESSTPAQRWSIQIRWQGPKPTTRLSEPIRCNINDAINWPIHIQHSTIQDPQQCLRGDVAIRAGGHTVFLLQKQDDAEYWLPIELEIGRAKERPLLRSKSTKFEPLPLGELLNGRAGQILSRPYDAPRPGLCSLNLPDGLLGGWANFDVQSKISDLGLQNGGTITIPNGPIFNIPSSNAPNCRFASHWALDSPSISVPLQGHARAVHLLLLGTTFPQATRSTHATVQVVYGDNTRPEAIPLRSPNDWWPVEQDYLLDDYIFRLDTHSHPALSTDWRVDLETGKVRPLSDVKPGLRTGTIPGGAAFVVRVELDPQRELKSLELHCMLYGVVLGLLAVTLEQP